MGLFLSIGILGATLAFAASAESGDFEAIRENALRNPRDAACRLVFADYLEEFRGGDPVSDAHRELIRIWEEFDDPDLSLRRRRELEGRQQVLLREHYRALAPGVDLPLRRMLFFAGFPREVIVTPSQLVDNVGPLTALRISGLHMRRDRDLPVAAGHAELSRLTEKPMEPLLEYVRHLNLGQFRTEHFRPGAWAYRVPRMETLILDRTTIRPGLAQALGNFAHGFPALRVLRVRGPMEAAVRRRLEEAFRRPGFRLEVVE